MALEEHGATDPLGLGSWILVYLVGDGRQRFSAAEKMLAGDRPGDGESTTDPCDPPPDSWSAGFDLDLGVGVSWLDGAVVYRSHACMVGVGSHDGGHSWRGGARGRTAQRLDLPT